MARSLALQILAEHLVEGSLEPGREIGIRIDHGLLQDTTGPMALLQFEAMGIPRVRAKRAVAYADHNTLQVGFENMDDHLYMASVAQKYGLWFSRPGNGICHQLNLERFSVPGDTLLGADSHTTTGGAVGMLAMGAGGLDVACALAGRPFYLPMPQVLEIRLEGALTPWVSAKDVALEVLRQIGVSGGRGKVLEFTGPGVATLSVPQRATIANMSIETGAFTAVFPSDARTREFFAAQDRLAEFRELSAEPGASYDGGLVIDLTALEPLVALPHSPDKVVAVKEVAGLKTDQVAIGSCTNSALADLLMAAQVLEGRRVPADLSLIVAPGSRQVLHELIRAGALGKMLSAGARLMESACGFCVGIGQAPGSAGVCVRTANRNFPGRSGTADAGVYLVGVETAVATALAGCLTDPRELGAPPAVELPQRLTIDDALLIPPTADGSAVTVRRGPNIAPLPLFQATPDTLEGPVLLCLGDNITTDDIMPAGARIMSLRSNIPAISQFVFHGVDPNFPQRAKEAGTGFIVGGQNYGQGSSREHAALAPRYLGVAAVVAISYARIHKANLVNFGILPLELSNPDDWELFASGHRLRLENIRQALAQGESPTVVDLTRGETIPTRLDISDRQRQVLLAGGTLAWISQGG